LSKLAVKCRYEIHGCEQILPYNHLETHEEICGYQQKTCSGCEKDFALKDFKSHESTCPLVTLTCPECNTNYRRQDQDKHTETKCLREQLIQVKAVVKTETISLQEQFVQMKATAETETKSLREQLQELRTRIGQLENRSVTETVSSAETATSIPIIEESQN
jgi:hypothetical protein